MDIKAVPTEWSLPTNSLDSVFYGDLLKISAVSTEWLFLLLQYTEFSTDLQEISVFLQNGPSLPLHQTKFSMDLLTEFCMDLLEISVVITKEPEDFGLTVVLVRNCQDLVI